MQRLKSILSSLAAKILIVPFTLLYVAWTFALPAHHGRASLVVDALGEVSRGLGVTILLSEFLLISAPYLIERSLDLRIFAIPIYLCSLVIPTWYFYFFFANKVYRYRDCEYLVQLPTLAAVAVIVLYIVALSAPPSTAPPDPDEPDA